MDKPRYTQLCISCDCILGKLPKVAVFDKYKSSVRTKPSRIRCTYYCKNCGAVWVAEWYWRESGWTTRPRTEKVKRGKHP